MALSCLSPHDLHEGVQLAIINFDIRLRILHKSNLRICFIKSKIVFEYPFKAHI